MRTSKRERKERIPLPKRIDYNPLLEELARYNDNHREMLEVAEEAGCYHCCKVFSPSEIVEWVDNEQTALCPRCGIDSVLPSETKGKLAEPILRAMSNYWFKAAYSFKIKDGIILDVKDEEGLYDPIEFAEYRERVIEKSKQS